jgi:hypothetical protein
MYRLKIKTVKNRLKTLLALKNFYNCTFLEAKNKLNTLPYILFLYGKEWLNTAEKNSILNIFQDITEIKIESKILNQKWYNLLPNEDKTRIKFLIKNLAEKRNK